MSKHDDKIRSMIHIGQSIARGDEKEILEVLRQR